MVTRVGTLRTKTRKKLRKPIRGKGKISISRYFQVFKPGEKVVLAVEPGVHKGIYHPRFHRKSGLVQAKEGKCYRVLIKDGKKAKVLIVHPVHLQRL